MKKIMTLFIRREEKEKDGSRKIIDPVSPGAEWVINGEGYATRKWDGLAVKIQGESVFMRFDLKTGRTRPEGFVPAQPEPDLITGHWPGWVPAEVSTGKWVMEAVNKDRKTGNIPIPDGTYEVCGPKIGTRHGVNPENLTEHVLIPHGKDILEDAPRTYSELRDYLLSRHMEGIVWYHPDGRMVKLKKADFPA